MIRAAALCAAALGSFTAPAFGADPELRPDVSTTWRLGDIVPVAAVCPDWQRFNASVFGLSDCVVGLDPGLGFRTAVMLVQRMGALEGFAAPVSAWFVYGNAGIKGYAVVPDAGGPHPAGARGES